MYSAQKILSVWVLIVLLFGFVQCNKIEVEQPIPKDTATIVLPVFRLAIDSTGKASFSLDTLLNTYPDFSIRFDPILNGKFIIDIAKREVRFEKNNNNWTRDSTKFELCVGGNCNTGNAVVRNYISPSPVEPEPAGCDTILPIGPILVGGSFQTVDVSVSIKKSSGKITEIRNGIYGPHTILPDSTKIRYRAAGNPTYFGYDEVGYTLVDSVGKCRRGIIRFRIGDPCDIDAGDDVLTISGVLGQWNVNQLLANELSTCGIPLDGFQFRLVSDRLNYGDTTIFTPNGIATDSTINGTQTFFYKKRNLTATKDSLWYYLFDKDNSLRVTRAKIRINFQ